MKIIIADASPLYRLGVQVALDHAGIVAKISCVDSFCELTRLLSKRQEAVIVILDARLNGLEELEHVKRVLRRPDTQILMLTDNKDITWMRRVLFCGVSGVIAKTASLKEFGEAIKTVLDGCIWRYDDEVPNELMDSQKTRLGHALCRLSGQENHVLKWVRCGLRNKQIAHQMSLTEHTIKTHMSNILRKLEIENRTQLVVAMQAIKVDQWPNIRS
ncbi:helix-turn-helix transcriptional regulator [Neptunomonas japonica]|uniref:LuxR family transcriptional regulator n=1 Tax=Neptunomonas japonica JAMM 1380 TaxID=1441457 RepID=A0A7R6SW72_9GAMM|nr:response regulator transcription factor [Neptunomonas japonica]BBB29475.1 LuxR family transcriptional regulator [Neptunomonas japonica JAMM 1380]